MKFFKRKADRSKRKEKVDDEKTSSSRSGGESLRGLLQLQTDVVESDAVKGGASEPTKLYTETASLHNLYHTQNSTLTEYTNNRTYNPTVTFDPACDKGTVKSDTQERRTTSKIEDELHMEEYKKIPTLESVKLPRGGVSVDTEAVGRIQFGIPPETIKDSMQLGLDVPLYYIVPRERFCRDMGPALGVNLAEFEFPAYFNFFIKKQRCTLIVDSIEDEENIRKVFGETLLGPAQFRREENPVKYQEEDFAPEFPREEIPDFSKELKHFRKMPDGSELVIETLLNFIHFQSPSHLGGTFGYDGKSAFYPEKLKVSFFHRVKYYEVAVIYPPDATDAEKANNTCKRVEVLKSPCGSDYIVHDIDENDKIVGKARIYGYLRVSSSLSVHGFGDVDDDVDDQNRLSKVIESVPRNIAPPSFYPPSFGVTVLGNSHGFDASGSVSGYVLWINGRGIMIDPPPYSSATLEREGIRSRLIVGIILTHCHADHDAGAFQKVLTGSPVAVITTPTIYKSFIRKYSALSELTPELLRHSHRYTPAIIGKPLRFQGATFHFTYMLHSIPTVGFRVEWRGRSIVFTGDHFNSPDGIAQLQKKGVLSAERAESLQRLPLQHTDLLLHEAGVPPLHTPLEVLQALPQRVKDHLYVVHTQKLPEGCELRVAPTGTAGTIRLDEKNVPSALRQRKNLPVLPENDATNDEDENIFQSMWMSNEYNSNGSSISTSNENLRDRNRLSIYTANGSAHPPKVALRPTSSTDAWFILNLLNAVPFVTGLSYAQTMELLETVRVDCYSKGDVVVPVTKRHDIVCVVWEGTCIEKRKFGDNEDDEVTEIAIWHAGDWTGPISLQPQESLSAESYFSKTHDIVASSEQGVKAITIEFASLHAILMSGSSLYRSYLDLHMRPVFVPEGVSPNLDIFSEVNDFQLIDVIKDNSTLKRVSAVEMRHFESIADGFSYFGPGDHMWETGTPVNKAYIVIAGTASFMERNGHGELSVPVNAEEVLAKLKSDGTGLVDENILTPKDANTVDLIKLSTGLQQRADQLGSRRYSDSTTDKSECSDSSYTFASLFHNDPSQVESEGNVPNGGRRRSGCRANRRGSRRGSLTDRLANKQLVNMYSRGSNSSGLVFSRGHFLGDVTKMMAGFLLHRIDPNTNVYTDGGGPQHSEERKSSLIHDSTLVAGSDGCIVLEFSKYKLIPFFDDHPGLLLGFMGTHVVL